jgi:hypothetical protein
MAIKISIFIAFMFIALVMLAWSQQADPRLKLTVKGNDELGIKLELPFLKESPADVIVTNDGDHYLLAYKIRWESIKFNGEVVERQSIGYHPLALLEKDRDKRRGLLVQMPLLPPHTKWFKRLGGEMEQITVKVPTLEELGRDPELFPDIKEYKQINVTIDGVILEDERVVAREPVAFKKEIDALVADYAKDIKEYSK